MGIGDVVATLVRDFPLTVLTGILCGGMCAAYGVRLYETKSILFGVTLSQSAMLGIAASFLNFMPSSSLWSALIVTVLVALVALPFVRGKDESRQERFLHMFVLVIAARILILSRTSADATFEVETSLKGYLWIITSNQFLFVVGAALLTLSEFIIQRARATGLDEETPRLPRLLSDLLFMLGLGTAVGVAAVVGGDIFVLGFIVLPYAIVRELRLSSNSQFLAAVTLGLIIPVVGLTAAFRYDTPPGATPVVILGLLFLFISLGRFAASLRWYLAKRRDQP
jgi:manganese/iron transport system permease protein